ncbi:MAG: hypothetical protein HFH12_11945 [Dorea sp.]|nr:hypothetical protein [Dorea sp.]
MRCTRKGAGGVETKEYYEINLPPYLQHDLDEMKEGKYPYDCLWGELYGSINSAFIDGDIAEDHAWYLQEKYLNMERNEKVD